MRARGALAVGVAVVILSGCDGATDPGLVLDPAPSGPVASVTVVPANITVGVDGAMQVAAVARNAAGGVLAGKSVVWTIIDAHIAIISALGAVTGKGAGSSSLQAQIDGVVGNATLSVADAPNSWPTWPNLPEGYTPLTDEPFDGNLTPLWQLIWNEEGNGSLVVDQSSPGSPGGALQLRYPAGFAGGSAPATAIFPLGAVTNAFIGLYWKANAGWEGHPSNVNKIQFVFPNIGAGDITMVAYGPPGGPYELRVNTQLRMEERHWLNPNVSQGLVTIGAWNRIEWLLEYGTPGKPNGRVRWWLNGSLVGDYSDVVFPSRRFGDYKISPTWGGVGGTKTQTDYFWFDHVFIAWK